MRAVIKVRRGTTEEWVTSNRVLAPGEPGYDTTLKEYKVGDGVHTWLELEAHISETAVQELINSAPSQPSPVLNDSGTTPENLAEHVNSATPHPAYDDGPSLLTLYRNAKV